MQSKAASVEQYLDELPEDRRAALQAVREVIRKNLDAKYEEGMQYGMIGYYVPKSVYPAGYHADPKQPLPFASLAAQKGHMALYMMALYCGSDGENDTPQTAWFKEAWKKSGKKLDMGNACIRFKKLEDLALDVLGQAVKRMPAKEYIARYEASIGAKKKPARKSPAKKPAAAPA